VRRRVGPPQQVAVRGLRYRAGIRASSGRFDDALPYMRMRPGGQLAWARAGSGAARLLLLCVASGAMWGRASASGGAIFTGHIEAACVATMMVKMLFFAMVRDPALRWLLARAVSRALWMNR
jgi:hypothetical protein